MNRQNPCVDRVVAQRLGERAGMDPGRDLAPLSLQAVPRFKLADGVLTRVDLSLQPQHGRALPGSGNWTLLAATDDLGQFVALAGDRVILGTDQVREVDITHADSATFLGSDRVLITAPRIERSTFEGRTFEASAEHRAFLVDASSAEIIDVAVLDVCDAGVTALPHPHDGSVVLDAGEGQDGNRVFVVRCDADRLTVTHAFENAIAATFNPSGTRLLLSPHPSHDGAARVIDWPTLQNIASLSANDAGLPGDCFDAYGCFLRDDTVLLETSGGEILLTDGDLHPVALIQLGQHADTDEGTDEDINDDEPEGLCALGPDTFATMRWRNGSTVTEVWTLASP